MTRSWLSGSERIGIVTGLAAEARIARCLGWRVAIGGGTALGACGAARGLIEQGATALVSFGLAGGLDPALTAGALLVPEAVLAGGTRLRTDPSLSAWLGGPTGQCLLGTDRVATSVGDKSRLWAQTGCAALDLESGPVAEFAAASGLPFAVLRAVCDPAVISLPPAALAALSQDGRIGPIRVAASLARVPGQIPALLQLARAAARARRALSERATMVREAAERRSTS
jgi:adenosylhomocysteine nucleosidase